MTDFSKLSDQEINLLIAEILNPDSTVIESKSRPPSACITGHLPTLWVDYCNNPADAWQIIFENKIMLSPRCADDEWKAEIYLGREDIFDNYASAWHKNPLRAAMIVFLMMQEGD
ncbi:TPA: DUF2591 domain-containing protein [Kluyvera intermedia]|nr:DUF2591 domain-containing protein [Kluyvera intermedia]